MISIIRDTREQNGFDFWDCDVTIVRKKLNQGDYCLADNSDIIIERKANTGELYLNLASTKNKYRFHNECRRLQAYKRVILLCEFPESHLYEFPINSGIPESKWKDLKIGSKYLRKLLYELPENFPPLKIVFCENKEEAQRFAYTVFKELADGPKKKFNF